MMVSDNNSEIPFFPQYETLLLNEGKLRVSWFEANFSQSHYNVQNSTRGSNACTLIAVLMAAKCHQCKVQVSALYLGDKSYFFRCFVLLFCPDYLVKTLRCLENLWFSNKSQTKLTGLYGIQ